MIVYVRAAALGVVAGMRSQLPLALLAYAANQGRFAAWSRPPLSVLRSPVALRILSLAAIGELIFDKLPIAPNRHELGPLAGRTVLGGVAGAALTQEAGQSPLAGGLVGAIGAGLAADGAYHLRLALGRMTGLPDPIWGAVEDVIAVAIGFLAVDAT